MNNTRQRTLIYETVQGSYEHPTADDVFRTVRRTMPNISLGTVYRNLNVLTELGKIRKISVPGQPDHFDRQGDWHDHMVCEQCGKMIDITLNTVPSLADQLAMQSGMEVTGYSLVAQCICPACAEKQKEIKQTNPAAL